MTGQCRELPKHRRRGSGTSSQQSMTRAEPVNRASRQDRPGDASEFWRNRGGEPGLQPVGVTLTGRGRALIFFE
jgi:hypothetical protein